MLGGLLGAARESSLAHDPVSYLSAYVTLTPSKDALQQLAGSVANFVKEYDSPNSAVVAGIYLSAVARHMSMAVPDSSEEFGTHRVEIASAVGVAATKCDSRHAIYSSGILKGLARWVEASPQTLWEAHCEFLQCSCLAGHYRFARRVLENTWPRPTKKVSTKQVMRYYYIRGLVHMGCEEWQWAIRAFWTCLSISCEGVSAIHICARKKLVLVQSLLKKPTTLPNMSNVASRFFTSKSEGQEHHVQMYHDLCKAVQEVDLIKCKSLQETYAQEWQTDGNAGMVDRICTFVLHEKVRHLATVYSVVPLALVAEELNVPLQDLPLLLEQVNGLEVKIDNDMVSLELQQQVLDQDGLMQLMELTGRIRSLDVAIASSTKYQNYKESTSSKPPAAAAAAAAAGPLGVAEL